MSVYCIMLRIMLPADIHIEAWTSLFTVFVFSKPRPVAMTLPFIVSDCMTYIAYKYSTHISQAHKTEIKNHVTHKLSQPKQCWFSISAKNCAETLWTVWDITCNFKPRTTFKKKPYTWSTLSTYQIQFQVFIFITNVISRMYIIEEWH